MTETHFHIEVDWPEAPAAGARDSARLRIRADDCIFTLLADVGTGELRDHLRTSAVTLALWLADNWWRLRWESPPDRGRPSADWLLRHELTSAPGGTIWLPLMIYGTGSRIVLAPVFGANLSHGPLRYLDLNVVLTLAGLDYEAGLDAFFETVLWTCVRAQDGAALKTLLDELREERSDTKAAAWRPARSRMSAAMWT